MGEFLLGLAVLLLILIIIGMVVCVIYGVKHIRIGLKLDKDSPERKTQFKIAFAELFAVGAIFAIIIILIILFATGLIVIRLM